MVAERPGQENPSLDKTLTCKAGMRKPRGKPPQSQGHCENGLTDVPRWQSLASPAAAGAPRQANQQSTALPAACSLSRGEDAEPHPAVQGCCQITLEGWLSLQILSPSKSQPMGKPRPRQQSLAQLADDAAGLSLPMQGL